jgi:cell division protein FtsB
MPFSHKLRLRCGAPAFTMLLMRRIRLYLCREWLTLILATTCAVLALDFATGPLGMRDLIALRGRQSQLEITHQRLLESNAALNRKLGHVRGDASYLERLIREELGYVRPDEIVYRFAPETTLDDR